MVLRYAYTGKLPPERERARMARELLSAALSGFEHPGTEISFIGFREDARERIRNDEIHLDLLPKPD